MQESVTQELGSYVSQIETRILLKNIEDFVPVPVIEEKISQIPTEGLSDREQNAVRAFKTAVRRREEGKPENGFWHDESE
jgi:hypothetical protein